MTNDYLPAATTAAIKSTNDMILLSNVCVLFSIIHCVPVNQLIKEEGQ